MAVQQPQSPGLGPKSFFSSLSSGKKTAETCLPPKKRLSRSTRACVTEKEFCFIIRA